MPIHGKILGALVGLLAGGPAGALLGGLLGHQVDLQIEGNASARGNRREPPTRDVQDAFFRATFAVMGQVAKSDGRVSEQEIQAARRTMQQFALGPAETRRAIELFTTGKAHDFPLEAVLQNLHELFAERADLARMFVQIQLQAALWSGGLHNPGRAVIERCCRVFGISTLELLQIEALLRMRGTTDAGRDIQPQAGITEAYTVLGVDKTASNEEVTKAYRRLMNQNHPDKLVARGLPESMLKVAEEKTRQVRSAYELIRESRGMR